MVGPRLSVVFVVLAFVMLAGHCVYAAYRLKATIIKGNCYYEGHRVPLNGAVNLQEPCERWQCITGKGTQGNLIVTACSQIPARLLCQLGYQRGENFPYCCNRPACSKT
uniref:Single domain-containing protein n=1 Tax=Amblyomma maculatum TaxID=34609 RepID=G3MSC6_AMBMU